MRMTYYGTSLAIAQNELLKHQQELLQMQLALEEVKYELGI
jgi:hypothetical protein